MKPNDDDSARVEHLEQSKDRSMVFDKVNLTWGGLRPPGGSPHLSVLGCMFTNGILSAVLFFVRVPYSNGYPLFGTRFVGGLYLLGRVILRGVPRRWNRACVA